MQMPRGCGSPETCPIRFQLNADEIALNRIHEWINRGVKNRPWYRVLDSTQASSSVLSRIRASGRVTAERFVLHGVTPSRASANVSLDSGKAEIASINADLLGGKHRGAWQADFRVKPAVCKGTGNVSGVPLANLSRLMKDNWIEGSADASYEIQGLCAPDFWQSAEGMLQLDMADGSFPHVLLGESAERLRVRRFTAEGRLHSGSVEVSNGILNSPDGKFEISGTADFKQNIDLRITRLSAGSLGTAYSVGGTLAEPRVKQVGETEQARLKP